MAGTTNVPPLDTRKGAALQETPCIDRDDLVEEASDESFPASDPPSFNPTRAGAPRESIESLDSASDAAGDSETPDTPPDPRR